MAKQVNKYATKAAYTADTNRSAAKSAVSYITEDSAVKYDGVNAVVEKDAAQIGDLVVYDKSEGRIRFVVAKTLVKNQLGAELVPLAVVYARQGKRLLIVSLSNQGSHRWAHTFEVCLRGIDPTTAGTLAIIVHNNGSISEEVDVSWGNDSTLAAIAASISAQFQTLTDADDKAWVAAVDGANIILGHNYYLVDIVTSVSGTGGGANVSYVEDTVNYQCSYAYLSGTEYVRRNNYVDTYFGGGNLKKFIDYYGTNGTTPTGNIPLGDSTIVNRTSFESSAYCADLRAAYSTYEEYMEKEQMCQLPSKFGAQLRDGKETTAWLAAQFGTDVRGIDEPRYPAASVAKNYGVTVAGHTTGLESGHWWLPSVTEMLILMRDRRYNGSDTDPDPINDTLVKMSGDTIYGNGYYPWTCGEYNSNYAFVFNGYYGRLDSYYKYDTNAVRPVSAL